MRLRHRQTGNEHLLRPEVRSVQGGSGTVHGRIDRRCSSPAQRSAAMRGCSGHRGARTDFGARTVSTGAPDSRSSVSVEQALRTAGLSGVQLAPSLLTKCAADNVQLLALAYKTAQTVVKHAMREDASSSSLRASSTLQ